MSFRASPLEKYSASRTSHVGPILDEIERQTNLRALSPQMLAGPHLGKFLQMISRMIQPRRALELGAFTGYSSICLADGLSEDGLLETVEIRPEMADFARKNIEKAGFSKKIRLWEGDAADVVPKLEGNFDLVFLDSSKLDSRLHFELSLEKVRRGGWILIDNVLWHGKVADPKMTDRTTEAMREFNDFLSHDERIEQLLLPFRDGLFICQKL